MNVKNLSSLVLIFLVGTLYAFDKSEFDILPQQHQSNNPYDNSVRIPYPGVDYLSLANTVSEIMLLKEGCFTMGTTMGLDMGTLDDNQPLTFGHPYSKTSYPYVILGGQPFRLDQVSTVSETIFDTDGESYISLLVTGEEMDLEFRIQQNPETPETLLFRIMAVNTGISAVELSLGTVLDPALGDWGDGLLKIASAPILESTEYMADNVPISLEIHERNAFMSGMALELQFDDDALPSALHVGNWSVLTGHEDSLVADIYDLGLRWETASEELGVGDTLTHAFNIHLQPPTFPEGPFLRSRLPQTLDTYQNLVFPRNLQAFTKVMNNGPYFGDLFLEFSSDLLQDIWTGGSFGLSPGASDYEFVPIHLPEIYENRVYPLTLSLYQNDILLDVLEQNCFIPASAFSDTGLIVYADSVILEHYPQVSARFLATNAQTSQAIFELENENVFVYEDQTRIYDYSLMRDTTGGVNALDVVFVLDVTGSMSDEINQVLENLNNFTDTLAAQGTDYRLAMVTFLDEVENVYQFTSDVDLFHDYLDAQYAHGGGDFPENSLDALYTATQLQFRDIASRLFIWITDASYHIANGPTTLTVEEVVDALLANGVTCHAIGRSDLQVDYYDPIIVPTGGDYFDINGNFLDILLDIGSLGGTSRYLVSYDSPNQSPGDHQITLEVHYAGLGGYGNISYTAPGRINEEEMDGHIRCFPNPFNPSTMIDLSIPHAYSGHISIYNILGQEVYSYKELPQGRHRLKWSAHDLSGSPVSAGIYFLNVQILDAQGELTDNSIIKLIHTR